MKKTLSLFLAALMVFTSLFAMGLNSFAADNSISVVMDKSSYKVGEIATAKVVINANKISGLGLVLRYDPDVYRLESVEGLDVLDSNQNGAVKFTWASGGDTNFENKVIFTVKFKVLSTVPTDLILEFFGDKVLGPNDVDLSSSFALHHKTIFPDALYETWYYPAVKSVAQKGY
ncbi:MAG: cohesin domain-containing protein, partial [Ruminococcus sp.]|nr:cohesin domain-containing protein [Ruminococcus sp.]